MQYTGFVKYTLPNTAVYVVYRGTDIAELSADAVRDAYETGAAGRIDPLDWTMANFSFRAGTTSRSQLDDALALYDAAKNAAGTLPIYVVGQSLGGGLAGLVSAIRDVQGFGIDPSPTKKQLLIEAQRFAADYIEQHYSQYLIPNFATATYEQKIAWLESNAFLYNTGDEAIWAEIEAAYDFQRDTKHGDFLASLASKFQSHTIVGEVLTSGVGGAVLNWAGQSSCRLRPHPMTLATVGR